MTKELIYSAKVQIEDTDMFGVVYHPNYLKYYERARSNWLEEIGFNFDNDEGVLFVLRSAEVQYLKPLRLRQQFEVLSHISNLSKTSATFSQHIRLLDEPETIVNQATLKVTCINKQYRPAPFPEWLAKEFSDVIQ